MTDHMSALRAKVALLRAEYRHEWDYGTEASTESALKKLVLSAARLRVGEIAKERHLFPHPDKGEDLARSLARDPSFIAEHQLPRKK